MPDPREQVLGRATRARGSDAAGAAGPSGGAARSRKDDPAELRSRLDAVVARGGTPGLQYLIVDRAGTVFEHCAGLADIAARRPMGPATTMMAYSMSKTVTAAAVLQLVEVGAVELDESIDRLAGPHPYGPGITVRRLLCHTSGIPNPLPLRWVHPAATHREFDEGAALAAVLARHHRLASPPGERYAYSNIGYWLLARVVERASGQAFAAYVTERVLGRLGLAAGELGYELRPGGDHAAGYLEGFSTMNLIKRLVIDGSLIGGYEGRWLRILDHYANGPAFGGLIGTARGFAAFLRDQLGEHSALFGDATRDLFFKREHTRRGTPIAMTLGWHVDAGGGGPCFFKEGGGGGFHCMMRLYPAAGRGSVAMTNATGFDVRRLGALERRFVDAGAAHRASVPVS